jgi:hypothetical protein
VRLRNFEHDPKLKFPVKKNNEFFSHTNKPRPSGQKYSEEKKNGLVLRGKHGALERL